MPTTEFGGSDTAALLYIKERGYASYSSIKNVRDKETPTTSNAVWFKFGHELHSRGLEKKKLVTLSDAEEKKLNSMTAVIDFHPVIKKLLIGTKIEIAFGPTSVLKKYNQLKTGVVVSDIYGVPVYGRIDVLKPSSYVCDLKSTFISTMSKFVEAMDFLQAAIYMKAVGVNNFYYIGICKELPHTVMIFNVTEYPKRLAAAQLELKNLLLYIKTKL